MAGHPVMKLRYQPLIFDRQADREFSFSSFQLSLLNTVKLELTF